MPAIFQPRIAKNKSLSVRVIVICSDHKLLWCDSHKGVGHTSPSPESILHKIIILFVRVEAICIQRAQTGLAFFPAQKNAFPGLQSFAQSKFA